MRPAGGMLCRPGAVFPLSRFFSANQQFVGTRANIFWEYGKHSFGKFDKFVEIWHLVYLNTELDQNCGHVNAFLELWAQLFQENLGTRQSAKMLEEILAWCTPIPWFNLVGCRIRKLKDALH